MTAWHDNTTAGVGPGSTNINCEPTVTVDVKLSAYTVISNSFPACPISEAALLFQMRMACLGGRALSLLAGRGEALHPALHRALSLSAPTALKQLTVRDALNMALDEELARDEKVGQFSSPVTSCVSSPAQ